jgi:hypothetical protein
LPSTVLLSPGFKDISQLNSTRFTRNVVFFGAGASRGCGEVIPHIPPLGSELYSRLRSRFPERWGMPRFASLFENNFEEGMKGLYEAANPFDLQRLMCDMAIYLSEFEPSNNSNLYIQFLRELKSVLGDTIFSTLNYDLLFEDAVERIALETNHFVEDKEGITFLKLHGSCNFLPYMDHILLLYGNTPLHYLKHRSRIGNYYF